MPAQTKKAAIPKNLIHWALQRVTIDIVDIKSLLLDLDEKI